MTRYKITKKDLQIFGAGAVVNGTEAYVNANNGVTEKYTSSGLSAEMKTFYDKTLIELAGPNLVFDQFGQKRPIPKNGGKTIEFRKFNSLPKAMTPIAEGVTPNGSKLTVVPVSTNVDQYGDYVELTDMLELTSVDPIVVEATKQLASQAGRTIDTVVRNQIIGGTNVNFCSAVSSDGTEEIIDRRYKLKPSATLKVRDVFKAAAQLKAMNAPTFDGSYVAVIHPYVAFDLMQDAKGQWIDIQKYADPSAILRGEIGTLGGVRFVQSTEAKVIVGKNLCASSKALTPSSFSADATDSSCTYGNPTPYKMVVSETIDVSLLGREISFYDASEGKYTHSMVIGVSPSSKSVYIANNLNATVATGDKVYPGESGEGGCPVYLTMFLGANAYGTTDIAGGGIEHIVKQKGYGNDPLNQRSSVGWKATKAACRLVEQYMLRVESGSSFSSSTIEDN